MNKEAKMAQGLCLFMFVDLEGASLKRGIRKLHGVLFLMRGKCVELRCMGAARRLSEAFNLHIMLPHPFITNSSEVQILRRVSGHHEDVM